MQKQAPSIGRVLAMVIFALSCFGILMFLWLSFGGPIPLKPKRYEFKAPFPEATTLAQEADVRLAGVTVGKVKKKELYKKDGDIQPATMVTMDIDPKFAPIPRDTKAILRQKTLLGETYIELSEGQKKVSGTLGDGDTLAETQVEPAVQLDEIYQLFDRPTRRAFQAWVQNAAQAIDGRAGQDLNDALGNLEGFAEDGADVLGVLDRHQRALKQLVKNTGVVFAALNERKGALHDLVVNSNNVFEATASRDEALAETFAIFPTFLDESRVTLDRLKGFARNARPLARDLRPVARELRPTVRNLTRLAPDLEQLFRDLDPLITVGRRNLPDAERFLRGATPVFKGLNVFLQELNPILSFANFEQNVLAGFITNGGSALNYHLPGLPGTGHILPQYGSISGRSLSLNTERPNYDRANGYISPNGLTRYFPLGVIEPWDCSPNADGREGVEADGTQKDPQDTLPPCFEAPPLLWDGKFFPRLTKGKAPNVPKPGKFDGTRPANNAGPG
jgi:phospholipid/cholesterol/gamma-HCH transport system substrate-binding protein